MIRFFRWFLSGLLLWGLALSARRAVFHQQTVTVGGEAPFLLESALQFRMTRQVAEGEGIPAWEPKVQYPEGVDPRETYSLGAEWVYSFFASFLPGGWTLATRVRWVSAGLFSLSVPLAAWWFARVAGSAWAGWVGGLLLAVSPAFVVRSSGLELSRENLAFPFLAGFWLLEHAARTGKTVGRRRWAALGAGACMAMAQVFWDLSQYAVGLWVGWCWVQWLCRGRGREESAGGGVLGIAVGLGLLGVSLVNPYLRAKGFLFSPVLGLVLAWGLLGILGPRLGRRAFWPCLLFWGVWQGMGGLFATNYSHFAELLWAKIRFLNVKPEDPALLTHLQRIMWTPALNSSTGALTSAYFAVTLWAGLAAIPVLLWRKVGREGLDGSMVVYALATFPVYLLFFRFHVFLIVFVAGMVGVAVSRLFGSRGAWTRWTARLLLLLFLTGVETYHLLFFEPSEARALRAEHQRKTEMLRAMGVEAPDFQGNRWGRPGPSYGQVSRLVELLRGLEEPGPVLAGFGISGNVLADAGLPILLHPKFETPGIRERVRAFYEHLFLHTESGFRDWAVSLLPEGGEAPRAFYYVHGLGSLAGGDTREAPRYMVDALDPPMDAAVRALEDGSVALTWFRLVGRTDRFLVYRVVTPAEVAVANDLVEQAERRWRMGDVETARARARKALEYHWRHPGALSLLARPF